MQSLPVPVDLPLGESLPVGDARRHEYDRPPEIEVEAAEVEVEAARLGDERRRADAGELVPPSAASPIPGLKPKRTMSVLG